MSEKYNLKDSKELVGPLYPILKDAWGNVIDGFHRQRVDPTWPDLKLGHITDPVQLAMARLVANVCRREVPAEEKADLLRQIAQMTKWTPKQIAEALPMSYTWVMKYLPDEYKSEVRAEAGKLGGEKRAEEFATRRVAKGSEEKPKDEVSPGAESPPPLEGGYEHPRSGEEAETSAGGDISSPEVPVGRPTKERDKLLDRVIKYYPLALADEVWQRVNIPSNRLPYLKLVVDVLWEYAKEQGVSDKILQEAKNRFEQPQRVTI